MESNSQQIIGKKLWHIVQAVHYMPHKGISKQKILIDLRSLLKHGKTAGKSLAKLITFQHHHQSSTFHSPRKIKISCSNTLSFTTTKGKSTNQYRDAHKYNSATIAKAFDFLNSEISDAISVASFSSPFLKREDSKEDSQVDKKAEEFITRFYEQLSLQQQDAATPEYGCRRLGDVVGRL